MLEIIINTSDLNKDGIILDINSTAQAQLPEFFNTDGPVDIHIRCVKETEVSGSPLVEDYETGDSYLVSFGNVDDKPTGGTFAVTIGANTSSALPFDVTTEALQVALSGVSNAAGFGVLAVTKLEEGNFQLDWGTAMLVPEITIDATYLRPNCEVSVTRFRVGSISQRAQQVFSIKRASVASATVSTPFVPTVPTSIESQAITSATNYATVIDWHDGYAGSMSATVSVNGVSAAVTLTPNMTLEEIGTAISRHPAVSYASTTADSIAVSKIDGAIRVEFIGTLSGETLTRTIVSNTAANPTVITTLTDHGLTSGAYVSIAGNTGSNAAINGKRLATVLSATTFSVPIDCTASGGTGGTMTSVPDITFPEDFPDIIFPLGNTGSISFATESLAREFFETEADELTKVMHVKRLRGATSTTILATSTALNRELINGVTLSAPGVLDGLFVRKSELGTNVFTAFGFAIGTAGAVVTFNGAGGTPSSLMLTNATGLPVGGGGTGVSVSGTTSQIAVGGGAASPIVWTTVTGTGAPVRGTSPTIATPIITNIVPGADFQVTQNSVGAFKVFSASATVDTLCVKAGRVGVGTSTPSELLDVVKSNGSFAGPRVRITNSNASSRNAFLQFCYGSTPSVGWQFGADPAGSGGADFVIASGDAGTYSPRITITSTQTTINGAIIGEVQALSGAGAISLTTLATDYTSTGVAQALTLANGTVGQIKTITHSVDGGGGILTPTTKAGYTTITFNNAGDSVTLRYCTTAGWCIIGSFGAVIA